jgi:hypothetical protein
MKNYCLENIGLQPGSGIYVKKIASKFSKVINLVIVNKIVERKFLVFAQPYILYNPNDSISDAGRSKYCININF